ncbi:transcriptional regulator MerR [Salmonella enterica subsp. enterica serovar Typhi]|nr:transcriptional regulator MerR [Salmonella enterica subsp. enterica serovar Typhi]
MENNLENLTIGVFAKAAGVNVETIRFYQRKGLLREPDKPYGSIRRYGEADVVRVKFVKSAQRLGFSLDEIAELLRLDDGTHCEEASSLAEHKLKDVREKPCTKGECFLPVDRVTTGRSRPGKVSYALACFIFRFLRCPLIVFFHFGKNPYHGFPLVRGVMTPTY